jgi:ABC-type Fe3+/spermidine/putrescine transport system ATPase subunit
LNKLALETINLTKCFADNVAIREANLKIADGEFFSLLGPSGSGKTTLLRMIAGFETPTSGSVLIGGKEVTKLPAHKRPVNMVFQNYALFPHLNVFENIAFGLRVKKCASDADLPGRIKRALALVRLENFEGRYPAQLSGGEKQRVALARAIVNEPEVLLLDEPLSALDPQIREEMQEELKRLQERVGICFVMVTHDQSEALVLSNRIAVCSAGAIEQIGSPSEVYESPATAFVAQFIGSSNLITATVIARGQTHVTFSVDGASEAQTLRHSGETTAGGVITICVKPHAVKIYFPGELTQIPEASSTQIVLEARLIGRSYKGASLEYILNTTSGLRLKAASPSELGCKIGDSVFAAIQAVDLAIVPKEKTTARVALELTSKSDRITETFAPVEGQKSNEDKNRIEEQKLLEEQNWIKEREPIEERNQVEEQKPIEKENQVVEQKKPIEEQNSV